MLTESFGLFAFVVLTGVVHGAEPGHGWPVAAAYAMGTDRPWARGLLAAVVLGGGHLISSVTVVLGFFWLKGAAGLSSVPYLDYVAGTLLIGLGVREYVTGGHSHSHDPGDRKPREPDPTGRTGSGDDGASSTTGLAGPPDSGVTPATVRGVGSGGGGGGRVDRSSGQARDRSGDHGHGHDHHHGHEHGGLRSRVLSVLGVDVDRHRKTGDTVGGGLWGIAWTAFVLGFAHEEEFELIGVCTGTARCLELTLAYAASVVVALVGLTALLLAGYERYEDRVEGYARHFPTVSAVVLVVMGVGFLLGVF